jgi:uncharacterized membrane protein (DUF4010 family)
VPVPNPTLVVAIAVALGLLVGLEREWAASPFAGIRTFPLITALGAVCGLLAREWGGGIVVAGFVAVAVLVWLGKQAALREEPSDPGLTTGMAALVMFGVGVLLSVGMMLVAVVLAGVTAVLLQWKRPLHAWVARLGAEEMQAIARLVLLGMVILPMLPNRDFGPYGVLNPFGIWLMVVLIVGISLVAYVTRRLLGPRVGVPLAGVLGGLISSTATTVSYARRCRAGREAPAATAVVLMLASTTVFARVLFEVAVVAREAAGSIAPPLAAIMIWMALLSLWAMRGLAGDEPASREEQPPSDLEAAVVFGALYAIVLLAVAVAKQRFGDTALYLVAMISGLTDVDAITLSSAELVNSGALSAQVGWRLIVTGALANLVFKGATASILGPPELRWKVARLFGLSIAGGVAVLVLWP